MRIRRDRQYLWNNWQSRLIIANTHTMGIIIIIRKEAIKVIIIISSVQKLVFTVLLFSKVDEYLFEEIKINSLSFKACYLT